MLKYKIDFGPGYRICFEQDGATLVILLAGGTKDASNATSSQAPLERLSTEEEVTMPLTRDFRETVRERAQRQPAFRRALLREAIELMLSVDEQTGRAILRNYINATVGFQELKRATSIPATSLMRMFGPKGNPSARNLFGVLAHLQEQEGVSFDLKSRKAS